MLRGPMMERIVVVGAGRSSASIVPLLARMAHVTVVDSSPAALELLAADPAGARAAEPAYPITRHAGDATSRLVLEDVRGEAKTPTTLVVVTGDDRASLEVCRLGAELGFKPIVAIVNTAATASRCEQLGAQAVVKAHVLGQVVQRAIQHVGVAMATKVGSGRGEILEFRVLPSSPAIGVPLSQLRADAWRVAAIYRKDELVLPTGATTIQAEDSVLIVGDPQILAHVAESLRVGLPTFPLLHGPNVVVYLPGGRDRGVEQEAEVLTIKTRARRLVRLHPGATPDQTVLEDELVEGHAEGAVQTKIFEDAPLQGESLTEQIAQVKSKHPGVVVLRQAPRRVLDAVLGRGGREAMLCNDLGVPVLFPKGTPHYDRIGCALSEGTAEPAIAEVALDLARMFAVPFCVLRVQLPGYLGSPSSATDALVETMEHRARLHGMTAQVVRREGNPIAEWAKATTPADLCVIARRRTARDSYAAPDLALRLVRAAPCSVLVCTSAPPS